LSDICIPTKQPVAHLYLLGYSMASWFAALRDRTARARIDIRIRRLSLGNSGDIRPVGDGVSELRIHYGPGYRIYLTKQRDAVVILLAGGDKSSQDKDIRLAKDLARNL
jgi:putative addiction module killer protein